MAVSGTKKTVKAARPSPTPAQSDIERYESTLNAKQLFYSSVLDMGWRLAVVVIVPIVIGVKLDDRYNTTPSWTLTALILAAFGAVMVVSKSVKEANRVVNEELQESSKKAKGSK